MSDDLVRRIHDVRFTPVRLREGYDMGEVDDFLDELVDAVAMGRPLQPLVDAARFTPVRMREGYVIGDVDAFLEQLAVDASTAGASEPGSEVVGPGGAGGPVHRPTQTDPPSSVTSSVVSEQRGLFARLFRRS